MRIVVVDGNNFVTYHLIKFLINKKHKVKVLTNEQGQSLYKEFRGLEIESLDLKKANDGKIMSLLKEYNYLFYQDSIDSNIARKKPAINSFRVEMVNETKRFIDIAKRAGIKKIVFLGSFYTYFNKVFPKLKLGKYHPYIKARIEQLEVILKHKKDIEVVNLEIPYLFGKGPVMERTNEYIIKEIIASEKVFLPKGGSTFITVNQLNKAVYGAFLKGESGISYPLGGTNINWEKLIEIISNAESAERQVYIIPTKLAKVGMKKTLKEYKDKGLELGLNPVKYMDFQAKYTYIDKDLSMDKLGYKEEDAIKAIKDAVKQYLKKGKDTSEKNH
jgi:dihydroflavonol-4-reductase